MVSSAPAPGPDTPSGTRTALWAVVAAFGTYFSMYMFRKPFTAATYDGLTAFGIDLKTALVTGQIFGYFLSKLIGIKVVSEMPPQRRAIAILLLILASEGALVLFGMIPPPWNVACLFLNGLPLGMVFGLVVSFLEGRKLTELLTTGLCVSFILADDVAKALGQGLLDRNVPPFWMPAAAGLIALVPLSLFVWMLSRIPAPTAEDEAARSQRTPMSAADRRQLCSKYAVGIGAIVLAFVVTTVLRSIRADFSADLWRGLGETTTPRLYAASGMLISLGVLLVCGLTVLVRNNRQAFFLSLWICLAGFGLLLGAIAAHETGRLGPMATMVLFGLGPYLPYVAIHTTVFERMLAMTREKGTLAFLMTLSDSAGYMGYIAVMLGRKAITRQGNILTFFEWLSGGLAIISIAALFVAMQYFARRREVVEPTLVPSPATP